MRDTVAKRRPMIDLEQFERRLRQPSSANRAEDDPLAELARLVGSPEDPYKAVFAPTTRPSAAVEPTRSNYQPDHGADAWRTSTPADLGAQEQLISGDYPSIEAGLLANGRQRPAREDDSTPYDDEQLEDFRDGDAAEYAPGSGFVADKRSRVPLYIMAAIILAGVGGIGASFALKGRTSTHQIATVKAADGPVKVQPESSPAADSANQDTSVLDRSPQPAPVAVADGTEQPIDLSRMPDRAPRVIGMSGADSGAASVPAPPPPAQAQPSAEPLSIAGLIEPKKVKTVSVRPDGTVIADNRPPQTSGVETHQAQAAPTPKAATPKSTARVTTTPKPAVPGGADAARPAAAKPKPVQVADAQAEPVQVPAAPAAGGAFAAQLAAPDSEQEAREIQMRLIKKYSSVIPGFHPSIRKAVSGNRTVYRVRTVGLSKEDATALCQKVQSAGGACFVARN